MEQMTKVQALLKRITAHVLGVNIFITAEYDQAYKMLVADLKEPRIYIQCYYKAPCTKTAELLTWKGRKWYLSSHMTDDEVIKTAFCAVEAAIKHEIMEGFKVDNIVLFNPHVSFEALLQISSKEITRNEQDNSSKH